MSRINGDKSRFHRERKQKIARRLRNNERWKQMGVVQKPGAAAPPKPVSA